MEFYYEPIKYYLPEIRNGRFDEGHYDLVNGTSQWGLAVLEYDWIDVELNLFTESADDHNGYTDKVGIAYFCCVKGIRDNKTEDWSDAGYLDDYGYEVEVDWNADDWPEQLKRDMAAKLKEFAERFGLHYDKPNWVGDAHDFDVFDRLNMPFN